MFNEGHTLCVRYVWMMGMLGACMHTHTHVQTHLYIINEDAHSDGRQGWQKERERGREKEVRTIDGGRRRGNVNKGIHTDKPPPFNEPNGGFEI